jgi:hypothetical protein
MKPQKGIMLEKIAFYKRFHLFGVICLVNAPSMKQQKGITLDRIAFSKRLHPFGVMGLKS